MQADLQQYYATRNPGEVQVVGVDLWNGTASQLNVFRQQTGATFPLALNGALATGGNVEALYGTYDNYVVLNKQGIVRYHAALQWPHGNRYHLNEIRTTVDSLVTPLVDVPGHAPEAFALSAGPNPSRGSLHITLSLPEASADARVDVIDLMGRQRGTVWSGPLTAGRHEFEWDARAIAAPAGVYFVRVSARGQVRVSRVAVMR